MPTTITFYPEDTLHLARLMEKSARNIGGPPSATTYESGAKNVKLVNDEKQNTTDPNSRRPIYLSSGHFD